MERINKETENPLEEPSKTFPDDSVDAWMRPEERWINGHCSLTKREYFAAMAMQGMVSASGIWGRADDDVADGAVRFANALIKELNKK